MALRATISAPPPLGETAEKLRAVLDDQLTLLTGPAAANALGLVDCARYLSERQGNRKSLQEILLANGLGAPELTSGSSHVPVTLYVPAYNAGHFLKDTLPAVLNLSTPPAEILVIDDGSRDDTVAISKRFPVRVISHDSNQGLAAARNTALAAAQHELVACLDSDVAPDRYWLERLLSALADPNVAAAGGRLIEQHSITIADRWRSWMMPQHYGDAPLSDQPLFGCNSLMRRSAARAIGGYDVRFRRSFEDTDFSRRLLAQSYHTRYVPQAFCRHQRQDSASSVVDTCVQWRMPYLHGLGAYSSRAGLGGVLATGIRHDLRELHEVATSPQADLAYPSLLMLLRSPLLAYREYLSASADRAEGASLGVLVTALIVRALAAFATLPATTSMLSNDLHDLLAALDPLGQASVNSDVLQTTSPEALLESLQISASPFANTLVAALGPLPEVLRFPTNILSAVERSAELARADRQAALRIQKPVEIAVRCLISGRFSIESVANTPSISVQVAPSETHALSLTEQLAGIPSNAITVELNKDRPYEGLVLALLLRAARPDVDCRVRFDPSLDSVIQKCVNHALFGGMQFAPV